MALAEERRTPKSGQRFSDKNGGFGDQPQSKIRLRKAKRRRHEAQFKTRVALEAIKTIKAIKTIQQIAREFEGHPGQVDGSSAVFISALKDHHRIVRRSTGCETGRTTRKIDGPHFCLVA